MSGSTKLITPRKNNIIDIEASGLSSHSYPVEVGLVLASGKRFESLIRPLAHWTHWSPQAQSIHGITREQLFDEGRDPAQVCHELNAICAGQTLISDCWVFDSSWINRLFADSGIAKQFYCSPIEGILSEQALENWWSHKNHYAQRVGLKPHRALADALIIRGTLDRLQTISQQPLPASAKPSLANNRKYASQDVS